MRGPSIQMRVVCLLCFLLGGFVFRSSAQRQEAGPKTIRASRFELTNAKGELVGFWTATKSGGSNLRLFSATGKAFVDVDASPTEVSINLHGKDSKAAVLSFADGERSAIWLYGPDGNERGTFEVTKAGPRFLLTPDTVIERFERPKKRD